MRLCISTIAGRDKVTPTARMRAVSLTLIHVACEILINASCVGSPDFSKVVSFFKLLAEIIMMREYYASVLALCFSKWCLSEDYLTVEKVMDSRLRECCYREFSHDRCAEWRASVLRDFLTFVLARIRCMGQGPLLDLVCFFYKTSIICEIFFRVLLTFCIVK